MKRKPSKKLQAAQAAHDKFLRGLGIDPAKKPTLKGAPPDILTASTGKREAPHAATSDQIPGNGTRRDMQMDVQAGTEKPSTLAAKHAKQKSVAQLYPKGPYGPVSDPTHLQSNVRRPPT